MSEKPWREQLISVAHAAMRCPCKHRIRIASVVDPDRLFALPRDVGARMRGAGGANESLIIAIRYFRNRNANPF